MQPWLHPTHGITSVSRPAAAFAARSGSAIIARVIPTRSTAPEATSRSAASRSATRVVPISGTPGIAARIGATGPAIASRGSGGGGTMYVEPRYVAECPSAAETKSISLLAQSAAATSAHRSGPPPPGPRPPGVDLATREPHADRDVRAGRFAHRREDLAREAQACVEVAVVVV